MKIIHSAFNKAPAEKKPKHVPMYKDPVFMASLRKQFIDDHNKKFTGNVNKK